MPSSERGDTITYQYCHSSINRLHIYTGIHWRADQNFYTYLVVLWYQDFYY